MVCLFLMNKVISPSLTVLETEFSSSNPVKLWYHTTFTYSAKLNLPGSLAGPRAFPGHSGTSVTDGVLSLSLSLRGLIAQ